MKKVFLFFVCVLLTAFFLFPDVPARETASFTGVKEVLAAAKKQTSTKSSRKTVQVKSYKKKDGTRVAAHKRSAPKH